MGDAIKGSGEAFQGDIYLCALARIGSKPYAQGITLFELVELIRTQNRPCIASICITAHDRQLCKGTCAHCHCQAVNQVKPKWAYNIQVRRLPRFEWDPNRYIKQNLPCLLNGDPVVHAALKRRATTG